MQADEKLKSFLYKAFGISLIFYLLTAVFSVGFFSWDEHYQTLEFLSPRLGRGSVADLPWEYAEAARPWFQPGLYYLLISFLRLLGVENAAHWALWLRVFSAVLSWSTLFTLTIVSFQWFKSESSCRMAIVLTGFLCFLPFVGVRTSSENLSACAFFLGLSSYFLVRRPWNLVLSGALMGAAIQFRYQDALMVLGFLGYLIYSGVAASGCATAERRAYQNDLAAFLASVLAVTLAGVAVDAWGYGRWTFVPLNYFRANILQGRANAFSRDPLWFYPIRYSELMPPIGAIAFLALILGWIRKPLHVLTWVTLPFFVIHCLITHKEVRFLFPMIPAVPFLIVFGLESLSEAKLRKTWRSVRWILVPANFMLLVIFMFKPAYSPFLLYDFVEAHPEIRQIYFRDEDPFVQIRSLQTTFFRPPGMQSLKLSGFGDLRDKLRSQKELWVFEGGAVLPEEAGLLKNQCQLRFSAFPGWLNRLNFIPGIRYANRRSLFLCRATL